ncbi:MAG TPA: hypothetical protein VNZ53_50680 [Steroidobacteraceae bacterium]|nr:hypothetical protein [Steroidobacteraceae bacterium]
MLNGIRQDLPKDWIVSFAGLRKSLVNGLALRSNSLVARRLVLLLGTRFLPKIGLSSVLFSQQPEGGDGRLIFTVSCFSFRGALLCTVACH